LEVKVVTKNANICGRILTGVPFRVGGGGVLGFSRAARKKKSPQGFQRREKRTQKKSLAHTGGEMVLTREEIQNWLELKKGWRENHERNGLPIRKTMKRNVSKGSQRKRRLRQPGNFQPAIIMSRKKVQIVNGE